MPEQKTKPTASDIDKFINSIDDETQRDDSKTLTKIFKKVTKLEPVLWTGNMIGFGKLHYKYASGHEGDTFKTGFSPRKAALTLYLCGFGFSDPLFQKLGKFKTGKGCLYIKKLEDVDIKVLEQVITKAFKEDPFGKKYS